MLENKPWSLQCVNWNKRISKINLSNLFGLLEKKKIGTEPGWLLPIEHEAGRWAGCWAGAGACGLALGCALGALGLFLARFDSVVS